MANEINLAWPSAAATVYAIVRKVADGTVWDVAAAAWEAWADGSIGDYDIPLTDLGGDLYAADFPAAIADGTQVRLHYYERAGAAPAVGDTQIGSQVMYWLGAALTPTSPTAGLVLVARAQQAPQLAAVNATLLASLIAAGSAAFERWTHRRFALASYVEVRNGEGLDSIILNRYPVVSLTSVTIKDDDDVETIIAGTEFRVEADTGIVRFKPSSTADYSTFPKGFQNVSIIYSAGCADIPEDVQEAVVQIVAWLLSGDTADPAMSAETLGDYSYTKAVAGGMPKLVQLAVMHYRDYRIGA